LGVRIINPMKWERAREREREYERVSETKSLT